MDRLFSTGEVVTAAGVLPGTFQNWTKRGDLFFPEGNLEGGNGQGNHRRYSVAALMQVVIGAELIRMGLSPSDAFEAAGRFTYTALDRPAGLPYHRYLHKARFTLLLVTHSPLAARTVIVGDDGKLPMWASDIYDKSPASFLVININRCFIDAFNALRIDPEAFLDQAYGILDKGATV